MHQSYSIYYKILTYKLYINKKIKSDDKYKDSNYKIDIYKL